MDKLLFIAHLLCACSFHFHCVINSLQWLHLAAWFDSHVTDEAVEVGEVSWLARSQSWRVAEQGSDSGLSDSRTLIVTSM